MFGGGIYRGSRLLFGFARFRSGDSGLNGGFARIGGCRLSGGGIYRGSRLLFSFTRFRSGDRGFNGGFARIGGCRLSGGGIYRGSRLLFSFTRFRSGDRGFNGGFARIGGGIYRRSRLLFGFARPRLGLAGFAGGNGFAVIRFDAGEHDNRLRRVTLFFTHPGKGGVNGVLIFRRRLDRGLLMTFQTRRFIALQASLTRLKANFGLRGAFLFLRDRGDLGFLLAEVLHQRNIAWANPGAGAALNAICEIMAGGFVVLLAFAEPIKLLRQKIGRAGVRTGAAADAAFFLFRLAHFARRRRQQAVGNFHDRHVEPRQGESHQRAAHNHHRVSARAETGIL